MKLWLDDIRPPWKHGAIGFEWVKTYEEAIEAFSTGKVEFASLDHDLSVEATMGQPAANEKTGYSVLCWLEEMEGTETGDYWPPKGIAVHSLNPSGKERMMVVVRDHYGRTFTISDGQEKKDGLD